MGAPASISPGCGEKARGCRPHLPGLQNAGQVLPSVSPLKVDPVASRDRVPP
jgi:hypothetical protein